jgi:DNA-directed RNA polymerase sigma subunit (sigma70/sigma32)
MNVTRERVRQIEARVLRRVAAGDEVAHEDLAVYHRKIGEEDD